MGLSFAIPSEVAENVVRQLKAKGRVARGWLGVYVKELDGKLAASLGLEDVPEGALVDEILPDSPAAETLQTKDVIVTFDGKPVRNAAALPPLVGEVIPGRTVAVRILRKGKPQVVSVAVAELPKPQELEGADATE